MVWSEQIGSSIVVPSDRVQGDGRNYIVIGEDVPAEIASAFTAALVFRSGTYDPLHPSYPNGFAYWAMGISNSGSLEIVAYYYVVTDPSPTGSAIYYRQTLLSSAPPTGVDNPPVLALGRDTQYNSYTEGTVSVRMNGRAMSDTGWISLGPAAAGWTNVGTVYRVFNGVFYCNFYINRPAAPGGSTVPFVLPANLLPNMTVFLVTGNWGGAGVEIDINGTSGAVTIANGNTAGVLASFSYPLG